MTPTSLMPRGIESMVHAVVDQESIVAITDKRGVIVYANDRFCEISGYSRGELLGQTHRLLKSGVHTPEFYRSLWATILQGRTWRGEICNRAKDGHQYWVETTISPLREEGLITHFIALRTDITDRKRIEEQLLAQQKREEEERRMEALGRMADGVLHDLSNILTGVMGMAATDRSDDRNAMLQNAVGRMAQLTRTLRDYSTGRPTVAAPFHINPLLTCACSLVRFRKGAPRSLEIREDLEATADAEISGNEGQFFEVALNLLVNAGEVVVARPQPRISVRSAFDGHVATIWIQDNGGGIPAEMASSLFDPYSSSKGKGRGLGLSVARKIAVAHGGTLELESAGDAGSGACFRLTVPAQASGTKAVRPSKSSAGPKRFVLVSEDDLAVRRLLEHVSAEIGLTAIFLTDTTDLIAKFAEMNDVLAAAVIDSCDVESETGALACMRQINPSIPILLISGSLVSRGRQASKWGEVECLPKPFDIVELSTVLRMVAARAQAASFRETISPEVNDFRVG